MKALPIEECGYECPSFVLRIDSRCFHPHVREQNLGAPREILATDDPFPPWCPLKDCPEKGATG